MVRVRGFSHQTALPARAAWAAMTPCQWGGVQTCTTSASARPMTSRKSRVLSGVLPPAALTWFTRLRAWLSSTSQTASTRWAPFIWSPKWAPEPEMPPQPTMT